MTDSAGPPRTTTGTAQPGGVERPAGLPVERPAGLPAERPAAAFASDAVVALLGALGYRYLPLNPGSSFRGLHDSVVNFGANQAPQLLLCLHEEIAVSLAHGYAKATGAPAAAAVHDLVGLMHASMAVFDAYADRVPLLLLGGGGPRDPAARRPIDWVHSAQAQSDLVRPYVKWDDEPPTADAFVWSVLRAHQLAASAPYGPTYVTLDAAVQEQRVAAPLSLPDLSRYQPAPPMAPDPNAVQEAADLLVGSSRPVIVGGRVGRSRAATPLLVELVDLLGAAYTDDRNSVAFPTAHRLNCAGDPGVAAEADVVLAVDVVDIAAVLRPSAMHGARTSGSAAYPAVIDLSCGDLGVRSWVEMFAAPVPRTVALLADPLAGLAALVEAVRERARPADREQRAAHAEARATQARRREEALLARRWGDTPVAPGRLVAETWNAIRDLEWLLVLRNTRSWPEYLWEFTGAGQYLGHSGGGGVGYGPGAMVGGALAARDRGQIGVGIIGDGDLLMASGALWTAVHYNIPLLVVVNDNGSFYNDEPHQAQVARERGRPVENSWIGMRLDRPAIDLAGLARSYGCWARGPIEDPDDLAPALAAARAEVLAGGVAVVHVRTAKG